MPATRGALLDAALSALVVLPWSRVRMVDVATAAGVSRQTLYNEFGSKEGLGRALVRLETERCLAGLERVLAIPDRTGTVAGLVAVAEWIVAEAADRPLLRALLTGCWGERLPAPRPGRHGSVGAAGSGPADAGAVPPAPADMIGLFRDQLGVVLASGAADAVHAVHPPRSTAPGDGAPAGGAPAAGAPAGRPALVREELLHHCELAVRLALAHVVAPHGEPVGRLVRTAMTGLTDGGSPGGTPLSVPSPRAADR